jgi:plastocyanin
LTLATTGAAVPAAPGTVSGRVTFRGDVPALPALEVAKDRDTCGERVPSEALLVSPRTRGVRYAVVSLEGAPAPDATTPGEATLENTRCRFAPHVLAVRVGTELAIVNSDPVLHNLRGWIDGQRAVFNVVQPTQGQVTQRTIKRAGVIRLTCDAHSHMGGYLLAFEHPYFAVTDDDGTFSIGNVPPGSYRLNVWHEGWNVVQRDAQGHLIYDAPRVLSRDVTVTGAGRAVVNVELTSN